MFPVLTNASLYAFFFRNQCQLVNCYRRAEILCSKQDVTASTTYHALRRCIDVYKPGCSDHYITTEEVDKTTTISIQVTTAASIKIVNGDNADIEDHPWMVSLQIRNGGVNFTHECGGTIIDKNWVLTAGHCNIISPPHKAKNMQIAAGSSFKSQMTEIIPVKKYYIHESFDTDKNFLQNDLMLLELQKPLTFGSTINKIDLDTNVGQNYTGEVCTITGWGDKDAARRGNFPDRLQVQYMPVVTTEYCRSTWTLFWKYPFFPEAYWNKLICLQDNDKDSCRADSGGPVVCSNKLVGALSFGSTPCDGRRPSVHTRISAFLDWIKDKMNTKNNKNQKDKKKKKNDKGKSDGKGKSEGKGKSGEKGKGKTN